MDEFKIVPDGQDRRHRPLYAVEHKGKRIIRESRLGECKEFVRIMELFGYEIPIEQVMEAV